MEQMRLMGGCIQKIFKAKPREPWLAESEEEFIKLFEIKFLKRPTRWEIDDWTKEREENKC
jgi:hypothetical protein